MLKFVQILLLAAIVFVSACRSKDNNFENKRVENNSSRVRVDTLIENRSVFPITLSQAVDIARAKLKLDSATNGLVGCDGGLFWEVVYVKDQQEVTVSKTDGKVYRVHSVSQNVFDEGKVSKNSGLPVTAQMAADIATMHFIEYGHEKFNSDEDILDNYFASVCDLGNAWRVLFILNDIRNIRTRKDISKLPYHSPPDYVIDKKHGGIIYFSHAAGSNTVLNNHPNGR